MIKLIKISYLRLVFLEAHKFVLLMILTMLFLCLIFGMAAIAGFFDGDLFFSNISSMSSFILPLIFSFLPLLSFLFDLS